MLHRIPFAIALSVALLACTPQGPSREQIQSINDACNGDELCSFANIIVEVYSSRIGQPLGQGVSVTSAKTDGKAVDLSFIVPEKLKNAPTTGGRTPSEQLAYSSARNLCGDPNTRRFFDLGGVLNISTAFASGEKFADSTIRAC